MKTVSIVLEHDPELESVEQHDLACLAAVNGKYYHDCLRKVCDILLSYDRKKSLSEEQKLLIRELSAKCAAHFQGVRHDSR